MSIYVENKIQTTVEELWRRTQTPSLHSRWDLRFTRIEYLPRPSPEAPQRFLYSTRIGLGLAISGEGESVGGHLDDRGSRTSSLKFWSDESISLIREGSGFWKYVPIEDGVRFLTRYDYRTRFGRIGKIFDRLVFRPLLGWATAWSFDRLRLWIERDISPEVSMERSLVHAAARIGTALIWIYQGLVPKLLRSAAGEIAILRRLDIFPGREATVLSLLGIGEVAFGFLFLILWRRRSLFAVNAVLLAALLVAVLPAGGSLLSAPFNPLTLTIAMWALSVIGWWSARDLPSAGNCLRRGAELET